MGDGFVDDNSSLLLQDLFQGPQTIHDYNRVRVTKQTVQLVHQRAVCQEAGVSMSKSADTLQFNHCLQEFMTDRKHGLNWEKQSAKLPVLQQHLPWATLLRGGDCEDGTRPGRGQALRAARHGVTGLPRHGAPPTRGSPDTGLPAPCPPPSPPAYPLRCRPAVSASWRSPARPLSARSRPCRAGR